MLFCYFGNFLDYSYSLIELQEERQRLIKSRLINAKPSTTSFTRPQSARKVDGINFKINQKNKKIQKIY